ncbi:hypothetical protein F7P83_04750 [Brevibacterium luteolum]|nr:hypothetical protein [Brevibacterium luteolum]
MSPLRAAEPLLGGRPGAHAASGPSPFRTAAALMCMLAAFGTAGIGILLHGPCMPGYELPGASARMCASPVANALTGTEFPAGPGRASGAPAALDPVTGWFVELGFVLSAGLGAGDMMAFLLVINTIAVAAMALGAAVLMRRLAWLPVACISPAIIFSMGQSLDPVGVACLVWALVLLNPTVAGPHSNAGAGVLFAIAALINPLGILALLTVMVLLWRAGQRSDLLSIGGAALIAAGLVLAVDGLIFYRLSVWWQEPIDRGSLVSLLAYGEGADPQLLAGVSLAACAVGVIAALAFITRRPRPNLYAALTMVLGLAVVTLPSAPITHALWLLPAAALAIRRLWIFIAWALAEAALVIAVNLSDITAFDASTGLSPAWLLIFTCLRLAAVVAVITAAALELDRSPQPAPEPEASPASGTEAGAAGREATASGTGAGASAGEAGVKALD